VAQAVQTLDEADWAPYCTPAYVAMEAAASWTLLGHSRTALPILEKSRLEWADLTQVRDYALCVARLSVAYADVGELERACAMADEAPALAQGLGSRRVAGPLGDDRQEPNLTIGKRIVTHLL
jgi:hypothetical protein